MSEIPLSWRPNSGGTPDRDLYLYGIYLGGVIHALFARRAGDWSAWLMTSEDGQLVGAFATEQEAKDALVDMATMELTPQCDTQT